MRLLLSLGAFALAALSPVAKAGQVMISDQYASPGSEVGFPLSIDSAAGCASIQLTLNHDPQILECTGFDSAGIGSQFEASVLPGEGVVVVILTRSTELPSGGGLLGTVKFQVNPGARPGTTSALALANLETTDDSGVTVNLSADLSSSATTSTLTVTGSPADSDNDGMPDWWETEHSLAPGVAGSDLDSDHDGVCDLLEYAFGGNPRLADPDKRPLTVSALHGQDRFLALTFDRRKDGSLIYRVFQSGSLGSWQELSLSGNLLGVPLDLSDDMEQITVRSNFPMTGNNASPSGFMKVTVEKP
jgi:hypothetical protein